MKAEEEYYHGRKMKHDGYPIDKDGEMVDVFIDGPLEGSDELIKCHFYDEHFTNHIADKNDLYD